jgi:hypothetical protein
MPSELMPWERRKEESGKAFDAFACYRDLGSGRSIEKAAEHVRKSVSLLKRWSSRYSWVERVQAWDQEQERTATEAAAEAAQERAREIRQRNLKVGTDLQRLARAGIAQLIERDPVTGEPRLKRQLKVTEIVVLHRYGTELERAAAMVPTDQATGPDGEEELDQMLRGLRQAEFAALVEAARAVTSSPTASPAKRT